MFQVFPTRTSLIQRVFSCLFLVSTDDNLDENLLEYIENDEPDDFIPYSDEEGRILLFFSYNSYIRFCSHSNVIL